MYKKDFKYFSNSKTIYLDSAATTQKPKVVIDAMNEYYNFYCANTHRSSNKDSNKATTMFEETRTNIQKFINASNTNEIIFTKGVTESINFVANAYAKSFKTVIISSLEHHSNIVPWHLQNRSLGKGLEVVNCNSNLDFDMEHLEELLKNNPNSFVSIMHVSNAFGTIQNIKQIAKIVHKYNSVLLVDGAQSLAHFAVDVKDLDVDFYCLSSHKAFGPTGVGVLYVKQKNLKDLKPYQVGGATINKVTYDNSTFLDSPYKFEAGTQNIAGVIGFNSAIQYIQNIGYEKIQENEKILYSYLDKKLKKLDDIEFYNDIKNTVSSRSFNFNGIVHDDIGILVDKMNIALRVGHHCCQPIMNKLGIKGTIRCSISFYNDKNDIDKLIFALKKALSMLKD